MSDEEEVLEYAKKRIDRYKTYYNNAHYLAKLIFRNVQQTYPDQLDFEDVKQLVKKRTFLR